MIVWLSMLVSNLEHPKNVTLCDTTDIEFLSFTIKKTNKMHLGGIAKPKNIKGEKLAKF